MSLSNGDPIVSDSASTFEVTGEKAHVVTYHSILDGTLKTASVTEEFEVEIEAVSQRDAISQFKLRFGFLPEFVDAESVEECEGCGMAILESEDPYVDGDGFFYCDQCVPDEDEDNDP